jgi:hypothetical protein
MVQYKRESAHGLGWFAPIQSLHIHGQGAVGWFQGKIRSEYHTAMIFLRAGVEDQRENRALALQGSRLGKLMALEGTWL